MKRSTLSLLGLSLVVSLGWVVAVNLPQAAAQRPVGGAAPTVVAEDDYAPRSIRGARDAVRDNVRETVRDTGESLRTSSRDIVSGAKQSLDNARRTAADVVTAGDDDVAPRSVRSRVEPTPAAAPLRPNRVETESAAPPRRFSNDDRNAPVAPGRATSAPRDLRATEPADARGEFAGGTEGAGQPGARELEGPQSPAITIEKVAPPTTQVGRPSTFETRVRNIGRTTAQNVQIIDEVPKGARLANSTPRARSDENGRVVWDLGLLRPGATAVVKMEVVPTTEGQIGSVATVVMRADASARTTVTRPQLSLKVSAPTQAMVGNEVRIGITLTNIGTGPATAVVIEADVPPELKHEAGHELEFEVGTLQPKESRRMELVMTAEKAARCSTLLAARGEGVAKTEDRAEITIVAPQLQVGLNGPKRRVLESKATYTITVANPGTASARDVELVAYLPKGMKFSTANNEGAYDAGRHAVSWALEELPADRQGDVTVTLVPVEPGELKLRVEGKARSGLADLHEETVLVEGVAGLSFEVVDLSDPVEAGGETSYEVHVENTGSKSTSNVQIVVQLPKELAPIDATGPTAGHVRSQTITFDPLTRLAPKERRTYKFKVQASGSGDVRVKVQLSCDDLTTPVTKEEVTRIFSDR